MSGSMTDKIQLKSMSQLFSDVEARQEDGREKITYIPLSELFPFKEHPFRVLNDEKMADTVDSIKRGGIHTPGIVRPRPEGGYEIISGHRRHMAAGLAGLRDMPVIIRDLDDDNATVIMVDSNSQRENVLPSEKAFAYKMKLDAMKRIAGRPSKDNQVHGEQEKNTSSREQLAEVSEDSSTTIFRYTRLCELKPELLQMVDDGKLGFVAAAEISYLAPQEQETLVEVMEGDEIKLTKKQAFMLKENHSEGTLDEKKMREILNPGKDKPLARKIVFDDTVLSKYFGPKATPQQIEKTIIKMLEGMKKEREQQKSEPEKAQ